MKNKKILILIAASVLLIILILVVFLINKEKKSSLLPVENESVNPTDAQIDFLNTAEKEKFNLAPETKVEAIKRGTDGQVMIYKIIKN